MTQKRGFRSSKKKTIFVTGGLGFIGSHVIPELEKRKYQVINIDIAEGNDLFALEGVKGADAVIHLAALTSVNQSFKNPSEFFRVNVLGTAHILNLCAKDKVKLIYPSSAAVYHRELSPYAESKALAEDVVKCFTDVTPITILRFFNVIGTGLNPNSGSIMYNFLHDKKIVVYGDGEQTRDFISARDVAKIVTAAISRKWNGKVVDVGVGQAFTVNYLAGLFAHYRKLPVEYRPPRREIKWSVANTQMLKTLYKKPLQTDLKNIIKELCND